MTTIEKKSLLTRIKTALSSAFGDRLKGVLLFGSEARGEARPDSDIDVMVLLEGNTSLSADLRLIAEVTIPIEYDIEPPRIIDATPVNVRSFEEQEYPLYQNAKREGIMI